MRKKSVPSQPKAVDAKSVDLNAQEWPKGKDNAQAKRAAEPRHASGRRRFVDPATCEREYSEAEWEFMQAMQAYKQSSGRLFPTWSEVLEVLRKLGYEKPAATSSA